MSSEDAQLSEPLVSLTGGRTWGDESKVKVNRAKDGMYYWEGRSNGNDREAIQEAINILREMDAALINFYGPVNDAALAALAAAKPARSAQVAQGTKRRTTKAK